MPRKNDVYAGAEVSTRRVSLQSEQGHWWTGTNWLDIGRYARVSRAADPQHSYRFMGRHDSDSLSAGTNATDNSGHPRLLVRRPHGNPPGDREGSDPGRRVLSDGAGWKDRPLPRAFPYGAPGSQW